MLVNSENRTFLKFLEDQLLRTTTHLIPQKTNRYLGESSTRRCPCFPFHISNVRKTARHERGSWRVCEVYFSLSPTFHLMMKPRRLLEGRVFISINLHSWHNFQTIWAALFWPAACRTDKKEWGKKDFDNNLKYNASVFVYFSLKHGSLFGDLLIQYIYSILIQNKRGTHFYLHSAALLLFSVTLNLFGVLSLQSTLCLQTLQNHALAPLWDLHVKGDYAPWWP